MLRGLSGCDFYERGMALKKVEIFDMAVKEFREATKDPDHAGKAFAQIALCSKKLGRDDEAVTALREALTIESFSSIERVHMQYLLAQTLESLNRDSEALVVYRTIRREHPNFQDVDDRIHTLGLRNSGSRQAVTAHQTEDLTGLWSQFKPQLASLLNQTWQRLAHRGEHSVSMPSDTAQQARERRRQNRVTVNMLSQFFSKAHTVAGEGEVRDLSPSGCRIMSPTRISLGTAVECWLYPQDGQPIAVDEATVQWVGHREFGLRFDNVRFGVQRHITDMC